MTENQTYCEQLFIQILCLVLKKKKKKHDTLENNAYISTHKLSQEPNRKQSNNQYCVEFIAIRNLEP